MYECFQILNKFPWHFSVQNRKVTHECWMFNVVMNMGKELGKLQKTLNCILGGGDCWWPYFTSYHLVSHLGWQPLLEITKMAIITHRISKILQPKPNPTKFGSIFMVAHRKCVTFMCGTIKFPPPPELPVCTWYFLNSSECITVWYELILFWPFGTLLQHDSRWITVIYMYNSYI